VENRIGNPVKQMRQILVMAVNMLVAAMVAASVFAYYPLQLTIKPTSPPVVFAEGSNANKTDLSETIEVGIEPGGSGITITIHPSYHVTYYKNVTIIQNNDSKAYTLYLVIDSSSGGLPAGSQVVLYIYDQNSGRSLSGYPEPQPKVGTYISSVDLTSGGDTPIQIGTIGSGDTWEVDIWVYIPPGSGISDNSASATFSCHLVATPSDETPP